MGKIREEMEKVARENAIKDLKELQIDIGSSPDDLENSPLYYALDIAIKSLEQQQNIHDTCKKCVEFSEFEPQFCEDAISREAVIDGIEKYIEKAQSTGTKDDFISFQELVVKQLPSVTPSYNSIKPELKPCEDCISRQVVKDMLTAEWTKYMPMELDMNLSFVLDKISALPSVIPSRPKGKWIDDNCSICGYGVEEWNNTPYCPSCGAKMGGGENDNK